MSIIDPRTGNPLTAEPVNTGNPSTGDEEASAARASVTPEEVIIELNAGNIQQVLEASMQVPVLLGCYSPTNASDGSLLTVLEKLAVEYAGAFLLGKLDIDTNSEIAGQLGVRSVPDVKLVSQGGLVDGFQGALPEKEVREWLNRYFPAPADAPPSPEDQAEEALAAGDAASARDIYQTLIGQYPEHYAYQIGLARALVAEKRGDDARSVLDNLPPEERDAAPARGVRASIEFSEQALSVEDIAALGDRNDSEARYQRALRHVADSHYETGLEELLGLMKDDRAYNDDAARKTLLQVFDALGADHPLTVTYRRKLFALLY